MKSLLAHRAMFGEQDGAHGCLASSGGTEIWRSFPTIEMDLPDSTPAGVEWEPFFRGWPFKNDYYFARTEPDMNARRPGMVRTQVLRLNIQDVGELSDLSGLFAELTRAWSVEECSSPLDLDVKSLNPQWSGGSASPLMLNVAERLARGDMGEKATVIPGENTLSGLVVELWQRLPPQIRRSLAFGFSFSPPDLKHRSLQLACFPKSLQGRWEGYPNLLRATSPTGTASVAGAYLLSLPAGEAIDAFARESGLPAPKLHELAIYERVGKEWANSSNLDFEGWAAVVIDLVLLAPQTEQAAELKRISVAQAARHVRPYVPDDILCMRGFKLSALGEAARPISEAVSKWFRECFAEQSPNSVKALVEVLQKYQSTGSEEWKKWVLEGLRDGFISAPKVVCKVLWKVWLANDEIFVAIPPTKIATNDCETSWTSEVPPGLPQKLGEKILNWCSGERWWKLHAATALSFLTWQAAIHRHLEADGGDGGNEPIRILCDGAEPLTVVLFAMDNAERRVQEYAVELCGTHPAVFVKFDSHQPSWVTLLEKAITRHKGFLLRIEKNSAILFSILDSILEGGASTNSTLDAFAEAGLGNLMAYRQRTAIWPKLPANSRGLFLHATALGWFAEYFNSDGKVSSPEPCIRTILFGNELQGQRFKPATPHLITAGLALFSAFADAPENVFEEWLEMIAQSSTTMSPVQCDQLVQIISTKKWEGAAKFLEQCAAQSNRVDLNSAWRSYWQSLSRSKKFFWHMDTFFQKSTKQISGTTTYRYAMNPSSTPEPATALFLTALALEFKAVLEHLTEVNEKTVDNVVYAVGTFQCGNEKCTVVVAQTGAGNVEAATLTERAIRQFSPRFAFFVGIAGGLKDELRLGDVVVADKVYAYEAGKAELHFKPRPKAPLTGFASFQRANATARGGAWQKRIKLQAVSTPNVFIKPIAAGEKVIDSHYSEAFRLIKDTYGDAYAVAMEEFGFYYAMHLNPSVIGAVIRGISDFAENKSVVEKQKSQEFAACNAAAFAFEMLAGFCAADAESARDALDYRHL